MDGSDGSTRVARLVLRLRGHFGDATPVHTYTARGRASSCHSDLVTRDTHSKHMAMANDLDALLKTVIGTFNLPESNAINWATALKSSLITVLIVSFRSASPRCGWLKMTRSCSPSCAWRSRRASRWRAHRRSA